MLKAVVTFSKNVFVKTNKIKTSTSGLESCCGNALCGNFWWGLPWAIVHHRLRSTRFGKSCTFWEWDAVKLYSFFSLIQDTALVKWHELTFNEHERNIKAHAGEEAPEAQEHEGGRWEQRHVKHRGECPLNRLRTTCALQRLLLQHVIECRKMCHCQCVLQTTPLYWHK